MIVWGHLLPFPIRGVQTHLSSRSGTQRHREKSYSCPGRQSFLFRGNVQRKRPGPELSMVMRASTLCLAGLREQVWGRVLCRSVLFLYASFFLNALQKLLSLRPKKSTSWLQLDWASLVLSVQLVASPDFRILLGGLCLIRVSLNISVVLFLI